MSLPTPTRLVEYLEKTRAACHPTWGIPGKPAKTPGYHTRIADGTVVHGTRDGAQYIVALLMDGGTANRDRAIQALPHLLALQEGDPYHPAYGIWPWFFEEPIPQMAPPDWNWADFIGAQLIQIWVHHRAALPDGLQRDLHEALLRAAYSIFRRNVQPGYTNIALMGATVTGAVGEHLGDGRLLSYARHRLRTILEHTRAHGDFNEYNSPTYTLVAIEEMDRALYLIQDPVIRETAEALRVHGWKVVAEHYHPPTGTWAGPHSRNYGDLIAPGTAHMLSELAGAPPLSSGVSATMQLLEMEGRDFDLFPRLPCPSQLLPFFKETPKGFQSRRHTFIRKETGNKGASVASPTGGDVVGLSCFTENGNLASVNRDSFWTQCRPVLGYWKAPGQPAVLRLRMLHNGRDFASGMLVTSQEGYRLLVSAGFALGRGAFHPSLDRGPEPVFDTTELTLRWELTAPGADARHLGADISELTFPGFKATVHHPGGHTALGDHRWTTRVDQDPARPDRNIAMVEMVLHVGPKTPIDLRRMGPFHLVTALAFGNEPGPRETPVTKDGAVTWGGLSLPALSKPETL